jgi:hypothetical protein
VAGDEENNPLAQYEDLSALKSAEIATKQVVSYSQCWLISDSKCIIYSGKYRRGRPNMYVKLVSSSDCGLMFCRTPTTTSGRLIGC